MKNRFYVYEHWRPDSDICFYVGKGAGRRAYRFGRNALHDEVVATLAALGMCVEVRMVASGLTEDEAFKIEVQRIAFWRQSDVPLTNKTSGGEGFSGFIRPTGIRQSEQAKQKLSAARKGIKFDEKHCQKLSERKRGIPRKPFTQETIDKMRVAASRREEAKRQRFGNNVRRTSRLIDA